MYTRASRVGRGLETMIMSGYQGSLELAHKHTRMMLRWRCPSAEAEVFPMVVGWKHQCQLLHPATSWAVWQRYANSSESSKSGKGHLQIKIRLPPTLQIQGWENFPRWVGATLRGYIAKRWSHHQVCPQWSEPWRHHAVQQPWMLHISPGKSSKNFRRSTVLSCPRKGNCSEFCAMTLESLEEVDHFVFGWRTERVKLKFSRYLNCQKFGQTFLLQWARGSIDLENATFN